MRCKNGVNEMQNFSLVQQRSREAYDILTHFKTAECGFAGDSAQIFKNGVNEMQKLSLLQQGSRDA